MFCGVLAWIDTHPALLSCFPADTSSRPAERQPPHWAPARPPPFTLALVSERFFTMPHRVDRLPNLLDLGTSFAFGVCLLVRVSFSYVATDHFSPPADFFVFVFLILFNIFFFVAAPVLVKFAFFCGAAPFCLGFGDWWLPFLWLLWKGPTDNF